MKSAGEISGGSVELINIFEIIGQSGSFSHAMTPMKTVAEAETADEPALRVRRPRSFRRPLLLWVTALFFFVSFAALVTFIVCGALMFLGDDRQMGIYALAAFGVMVAARLAASLNSHRLHCQLCHGTVLHEKTCRKHVSVGRVPLLGYRSLVVLGILFTGTFNCMYCGSLFKLKK